MKGKHSQANQSVVLPEAFLPVLAGNADKFIVRMEGERIIFEPKVEGAKIGAYAGPDRRAGKLSKKETRDKAAKILTAQATVRPKFCYHAKDKRMTPENAAKYGLSTTRLKVYKAIYSGSKKGLLAKDIMKRCNLPHGSVQQTLNWLRNHRLVSHEVLTTAKA